FHVTGVQTCALPIFMTNLHLIGNLCMASLIASLATSSDTPDISNNTLPGFTTATQYSGDPLPLPIRVSAGFFVTGLSGNILIQKIGRASCRERDHST